MVFMPVMHRTSQVTFSCSYCNTPRMRRKPSPMKAGDGRSIGGDGNVSLLRVHFTRSPFLPFPSWFQKVGVWVNLKIGKRIMPMIGSFGLYGPSSLHNTTSFVTFVNRLESWVQCDVVNHVSRSWLVTWLSKNYQSTRFGPKNEQPITI